MSFEPVVDPGDVDGGLVAHGELVVADGQGSVVLEVTEAAFHGAAVLVRHGVEGRRRPPREPLARRWAAWSAVTGIVVRMRWARSQARSACEE